MRLSVVVVYLFLIGSKLDQVILLSPVGLEQDAIDLFEIDAFGLISHGFQKAGEAKIADTT